MLREDKVARHAMMTLPPTDLLVRTAVIIRRAPEFAIFRGGYRTAAISRAV